MAAFAGPWPEWPAEDQGKQLVSVRVDWDVDKLSRALFGSSSAFGVRIRSLQIIGLCLPARHGPDYPLRRPPPLRFLPPDDAAGPKCYAVFLCLVMAAGRWSSQLSASDFKLLIGQGSDPPRCSAGGTGRGVGKQRLRRDAVAGQRGGSGVGARARTASKDNRRRRGCGADRARAGPAHILQRAGLVRQEGMPPGLWSPVVEHVI
jgi:hypothetical protein